MNVVNAMTAADSPNPHGIVARELLSTEHAQVTMAILQPGEAMKLHITPVDVFIYALEGEGVVEIGDERETITRDMLVESPIRIPHRVLNESAGVFRCLVVKTPRPTQSTRIL